MSFDLLPVQEGGGEKEPQNSLDGSLDASSIELVLHPLTTIEGTRPQSRRYPSSKRLTEVGNDDEILMPATALDRLPSVDADTWVPSGPESSETSDRIPGLRGFLKNFSTVGYQLILVSIICLLGPGMWNALNGIGGAGLLASGPSNDANVSLYSTFSVMGFFAGIFVNKLGPRVCLAVGGLGYALYTSSLFCYKHIANEGFLIFSGLLLGICAGIFWAAQIFMTVSYPGEGKKGRAIGSFLGIYNSGAVIGSLISLFQNLHSPANEVNDGTFIAFIALAFSGSLIALTVLRKPENVLREDGTYVSLPDTSSWKEEMHESFKALNSDWYILLLFPMFFASNFFYPYQFNTFNLPNFDIRTRSLNNVVYWLAEIASGYLTGWLLELRWMRKSTRARLTLCILAVQTCGVWIAAYIWDMKVAGSGTAVLKMDYHAQLYPVSAILYAAFGFLAAAYNTYLMWAIGCLIDDPRKVAHLAGFYKGVQSAGAAVAFRVNSYHIKAGSEIILNGDRASRKTIAAHFIVI
ncbi:hypothetical protein LZ554_004274 [Drepanopeziza brunnea f. sp. 'monogermtubi']|nr:hypothetical protein LZ554_004274 [Drepanopeziza brunnea f. sp. 'monogermtubi']